MQSGIKSILLTLSIAAILLTFVLGQVAPVLAQTTTPVGNLVKRSFTSGGNQHLTASSGNTAVCGDHLCAPGEWTKMQEELNKNQIVRSGENSTNTMSTNSTVQTSTNSTMQVSTNSTMNMANTSPIPPPYPISSTPAPTPSPPSISPIVCSKIKADLANSTSISLSLTAKILSDLGCIS